jgi:hypothetical protein
MLPCVLLMLVIALSLREHRRRSHPHIRFSVDSNNGNAQEEQKVFVQAAIPEGQV